MARVVALSTQCGTRNGGGSGSRAVRLPASPGDVLESQNRCSCDGGLEGVTSKPSRPGLKGTGTLLPLLVPRVLSLLARPSFRRVAMRPHPSAVHRRPGVVV